MLTCQGRLRSETQMPEVFQARQGSFACCECPQLDRKSRRRLDKLRKGRRSKAAAARSTAEAPARTKRDWRSAKPIRGNETHPALPNHPCVSCSKLRLIGRFSFAELMLCLLCKSLIASNPDYQGRSFWLVTSLGSCRRWDLSCKGVLQPLWPVRLLLHRPCQGRLRLLRAR